MRTNFVMLAMLAGLGVSSFGAMSAAAENLSCITRISPGEQRLLRDCEPKPEEEFYVIEVLNQPPPPPIPIKNGEGGKGGGTHGHDQDHDAPAGGGDPGSSF